MCYVLFQNAEIPFMILNVLPISSILPNRYSTRIVANVADMDLLARNELAMICNALLA